MANKILTNSSGQVLIFGNKALQIDVTPPVTKNRVGGKIFYIDNTASGAEYTFYDQNEQEIENVVVGDEPYYYSVDGTPDKDKFYIVNLQLSDMGIWTYWKPVSGYVYNNLGTSRSFGYGKSNTQIVMNADNGAYISADVQGYQTIWYNLKSMRDEELGGCSDWYIASNSETSYIVTAKDSSDNYIIPMPGRSSFWLWTSSEYGANYALDFENRGTAYYTSKTNSNTFMKFYPIRSF